MKTSVLRRGINASVILSMSLLHSELSLADSPAPGFAFTRTIDAGMNPNSVAIGDFNRDGKLDLAVAIYGSHDQSNGTYTNSGVSVLLGKGDGTFQTAVRYAAGTATDSVAVGDLNGDGNLDLVVANLGSYDQSSRTYTNSGISVLLGRGDGTFQTAVNYNSGPFARSVAVGDFDGDGKLDLVVANGGNLASSPTVSGSVLVLLGKGDGTFQAPVAYAAGVDPEFAAVGDFDGDGKPDLAAANFYSGDVSILLGRGDGTFATAVNYKTVQYPWSLAVGDFNGDGKLDLAVTNEENVSMMLGNGDGTFRVTTNYLDEFPGDNVRSSVAGDFNGDGKLDLVATGQRVWVLLGRGDGTFQTAINYFAGIGPVSVAVGEFNGDGTLDLSVINSCESCSPPVGGVSVLLGEPRSAFIGVSFEVWGGGVSENEGSVSVGVLRSGDPKPAFNVEFVTAPITKYLVVPAAPGIDFVAQDFILTFAAGETRKVVSIPILDNGTVNRESEGKSFAVELKNASAGVVTEPSDAIITIQDNEVPANLDWSFLPAVAPASVNLRSSGPFTALKSDGTIVTVDVLYDPQPPPTETAHIVFLSEDGDATATAKLRLQNPSNQAGLNGVTLQPDGKLLLTGAFTHVNGEPHNSLVRLNQEGSLDSAFEANFGPVQVNTTTFSSTVSVLAVFPDGRIAVNVVDDVANIVAILVLGADGKFDTSFTPTRLAPEYCCNTVSGTTTRDGRILIFSQYVPGLLGLGLNGGVDDTFRPNFRVGTNTMGSIGTVLTQADGRLIVAGDFTSVNGTARSYIARLNLDGSLDSSFKAELRFPFQGFHGTASILSDGSILVLSTDDFVEFDGDGQVKTRFTPPGKIIQSTAGYFLGRFAFQSEVPKRMLVLNDGVGVNGVELGLARVLLEGAATSAFQIMGEAPEGGTRFRENIFEVGETGIFEFVVQRLGETTGPATVKFTTSDGTAKAGIDYVPQTGTLSFAPFETEKLVRVPLTELTNRESRVFFVSLSEPTGARLSGQPPVPVIIIGRPLVPDKITALRTPDGGVALVFGEFTFESDPSSLAEVSSDLHTWLPATGYKFKSQQIDNDTVVWIDNHSRSDSPRFYRIRAYNR